ncbi:MAG TPA: cupin domain-containing protein [Chloroflexota bacterium]|jgi:mannose-6-phosphate isomerase-like protein (cupin superfamily)
MAIKVLDLVELAHSPEARRQVLINGPEMNCFFHIYKEPGQKDEMHCHNVGGSFYVIEGECTMHFPDGTAEVLKPGMVGLIEAGSFYQLHNTGDGPMVMLGHHALASQKEKTILYETKSEYNRPGAGPRSEPPSRLTIQV